MKMKVSDGECIRYIATKLKYIKNIKLNKDDFMTSVKLCLWRSIEYTMCGGRTT